MTITSFEPMSRCAILPSGETLDLVSPGMSRVVGLIRGVEATEVVEVERVFGGLSMGKCMLVKKESTLIIVLVTLYEAQYVAPQTCSDDLGLAPTSYRALCCTVAWSGEKPLTHIFGLLGADGKGVSLSACPTPSFEYLRSM